MVKCIGPLAPPSLVAPNKLLQVKLPPTVIQTPNTADFPKLAIDIRGVDTFVHRYIYGKLWRPPTAWRCRFFSLRFFPESHNVCAARKSRVAYTFTNFGGVVLNDAALLTLFKQYSGKYRSHSFFQTQPIPRSKASDRIKYRKLLKRFLFEAVEKKNMGGVFAFRLDVSPATRQDYAELREEVHKAVLNVASRPFQQRLELSVAEQNRLFSLEQVRAGVTRSNALVDPRYSTDKLPFLR